MNSLRFEGDPKSPISAVLEGYTFRGPLGPTTRRHLPSGADSLRISESLKPDLPITTIFTAASWIQREGNKVEQSISKKDALLGALDLVLKDPSYSIPFTARQEEQAQIESLGVPLMINHTALFDYVASHSGIPQEDPFQMPTDAKKRQNADHVKFMDTKNRYEKYRGNRTSSMLWVGALELLDQAWKYHEKKPDIQAQVDERTREITKDTPDAGMEVLQRHRATTPLFPEELVYLSPDQHNGRVNQQESTFPPHTCSEIDRRVTPAVTDVYRGGGVIRDERMLTLAWMREKTRQSGPINEGLQRSATDILTSLEKEEAARRSS